VIDVPEMRRDTAATARTATATAASVHSTSGAFRHFGARSLAGDGGTARLPGSVPAPGGAPERRPILARGGMAHIISSG